MIRIIPKADLTAREMFRSRLIARAIGFDSELLASVTEIINNVRQRGDEALVEYALQFDKVQLTSDDLKLPIDLIRESAAKVDLSVLAALREAIKNVRLFHQRQQEDSWKIVDERGYVGQRITPIESVGLYVPGGTAAYPSSVIMNVVPAQVAGVNRIVVTTPPGTVEQNPAVAAALMELNVNEVYGVGGAQAVAALTFGTETISPVDKITGPGNRFVAAAKKLVFGVVGIDAIAGPSEVVIVADETARADFIVADLLAQAEHGEDASSILITTDEELALSVVTEAEKQVAVLPRREIIEASLTNYGAIIIVETLAEACELVNQIAPEHVELLTSDDDSCASRIKHAGAIFLGPYSPEAVGDYLAGPNHVLPTGRTARFSSALGVYDFVKRTSLIAYSRAAAADAANRIAALAEAEGLQAHANSAVIRLGQR